MKKIVYLLLVLFFTCIAFSNEYQVPEELEILLDTNNMGVLPARIFPIGWSKDGKFAYFRLTPDEGMGGGPFYMLYIQDMVTDAIVWNSQFDENDFNLYESTDPLKTKWDREYSLYKKMLNKYGIIQQFNFKLNKFPFSYNNDTFDYDLEIYDVDENDENYSMGFSIKGYRLRIKSNKLGQKTVSKKDSYLINLEVAGYLKSPFEDRMLIILEACQRGWEGPPNPIYFNLIGCHLKIGYK